MKIPNVFKFIKQKQAAIDESGIAAKKAHEKSMKTLADSHKIGNNLKHKLQQNGISLQMMAAMGKPHD